MRIDQNIKKKLLDIGINPEKENKKAIQKKIIHIYDLLQIKITQNMILKKQNQDIKLQINTINDLFQQKDYQYFNSNFDIKIKNKTIDKIMENIIQILKVTKKCQLNKIQKTKLNIKPKLQQYNRQFSSSYQSQNNSYKELTKRKSIKMLSFIIQNQKIKTKLKVSKFSSNYKNQRQNQQNNDISCKLQALIKQNQIIMKRMQILEAKYYQQKINDDKSSKQNFDDRTTSISSQLYFHNNFYDKNKNNGRRQKSANNHRRQYSNVNITNKRISILDQ